MTKEAVKAVPKQSVAGNVSNKVFNELQKLYDPDRSQIFSGSYQGGQGSSSGNYVTLTTTGSPLQSYSYNAAMINPINSVNIVQ